MNGDSSPVAFVDTNILAYVFMLDSDARGPAAERLLRSLYAARTLRTSTQVLQELYHVLVRKGRKPLTREEALMHIDELAEWPVVVNDVSSLRDAARLSDEHTLSFWDALIVVAAARSGAKRLYTEDLQHGRKLLGVEIVNPFAKN